jgi:enoyl-CoA hydratase
LVAGAVEVLFAVALGSEPLEDEPLLRSLCDPPVVELAAARLPLDDAARELVVVDAPDEEVVAVVGLEAVAPLVELVEMPSIVAPRPALPADAPPPDEPPPLPVLGGATAATVGALVRVAPEVTVEEALVPVLVKVWPDVTWEDCVPLDGLAVEAGAAGKPAAPLPTWPCPPLPGVGPPTGSVALGFTVCATAGIASANAATTNAAKSTFMPRQHEAGRRVPRRWLRRCASATVAARRTRASMVMTTTAYDSAPSTVPIVTIAEGRATIRLNRPREHNRLEPGDLAVLRETFTRIGRDPSVRVLVLTGTGKSFSSGYHIGALLERKAGKPEPGQARREADDTFETVVNRLEALRVPTIAALQGSVYGGATDLALACDFRIGVAGMRMLMPAARLGIIYYPSGIERYVNRLGVAAAKRLFLTAEPIEAEEMRRIGYLDEVVPGDELAARVDALCATLAANAPLALAGLKRAINETAGGRLDRETLAAARAGCSASDDHAEALKAWSEKRKPVFKGQ